MAKVDRSILQANDQNMGDFGDPNKLEASISHLADKIDFNDGETQTLKTDNTSNKGRLTALEEDVGVLETDNISNKNRISSLENDNSTNKNRIGVLEVDNTSNKSRISSNETNIAYNEGRLTELLRNQQKADEVVDARMGFPVLRNKLESIDNNLKQRGINIAYPPAPLVAAKGDGTDETTVLQNLLNASSGGILYWPKGIGVEYQIGELAIPSDTMIIFGQGVKIKAKLGITTANVLFRIRQKNNISIFGNFVTFSMNKNEYTSSYNHAFYIGESENIYIEKVVAKDAPMDGFYIGGNSSDTKACKNITLKECTTENAKRNGVSVTYAENVNLIDCNFNLSSGMNPQAGIDIEPNAGTYTKNISVLNCRAFNNTNSGFVVSALAEDVIFDNCRAYNNGASGFSSIVYNNLRPKDIRYKNCIAKGNFDGFTIDALEGIEIVNCISDNNNNFGINVTLSTSIRIISNKVKSNANRGITVSNSTDPIIEGNSVMNNGSAGIMTSGGSVTNPIIRNNYTKDNGTNTALSIRSNIHISGCSKASILNNVCRTTLGTIDTPIGLNVANNATNSFVKDNDCFEGGVTGIYIDSGSGSTNAGNRNKSGAYSTVAS